MRRHRRCFPWINSRRTLAACTPPTIRPTLPGPGSRPGGAGRDGGPGRAADQPPPRYGQSGVPPLGGAGGGAGDGPPQRTGGGTRPGAIPRKNRHGLNRPCRFLFLLRDDYYSLFTNSARMALSTARIITPTSANMASHMLAIPRAPRIRHSPLMPRAKAMFS